MIKYAKSDDLLTLIDLDKGLDISSFYFNSNGGIPVDPRKELMFLLQNFEIIIKKGLQHSGVINKSDSWYYSHDLVVLFDEFKNTALGSRCISFIKSNGYSDTTLSLLATIPFVTVRYSRKGVNFYNTVNYVKTINVLKVVIYFLTQNGVV